MCDWKMVANAYTGRDATEDFEDVGHSKTAISLMEKFLVGDFEVLSLISTFSSFTRTNIVLNVTRLSKKASL